ncbi:plant self-incompatibility protein S1 family [Striga asiatica]|uniref:S-protein homolog n=1 Tax=Striga asiatica TaxID=4170 RepID=A0A5A7P8U2_STRAF|nr:plant self-incompatibility protein S1 family [Striga asiatica]
MSDTKGLVLLVLFTYIFLTKGCFTDEYEVHLINRLPYPRLKFHCASGDNELGYHKVVPNFDFHWKFCENIWKKTLYFCHLWWEDKEIAFDIFTSKHSNRCRISECFWEARKDGFRIQGSNFIVHQVMMNLDIMKLFQTLIFIGSFVIVIPEKLYFFAIFGGEKKKLLLIYLPPNTVIDVDKVNVFGKQGLMF